MACYSTPYNTALPIISPPERILRSPIGPKLSLRVHRASALAEHRTHNYPTNVYNPNASGSTIPISNQHWHHKSSRPGHFPNTDFLAPPYHQTIAEATPDAVLNISCSTTLLTM